MSVQFPELPPFPDGTYRTIKADPPWAYDDSCPGPGRGADSHYDTLDAHTVAGMGPQVREVTDSVAHCYLWTTNAFLDEALTVLDNWGFDYKTTIVWVKKADDTDITDHSDVKFGMGHYYRNATELLLFGTKGNLSTNHDDRANVIVADRQAHSAKPEASYDMIERMSDGPYLELFGRGDRDGWTVWGDEADQEVPNP